MATNQHPDSTQYNGARIALDANRPILRGVAAMSVAPEPHVPASEAMVAQDFAAALEDIVARAGIDRARLVARHPGAHADAGEIVARVRALIDQALRCHRDVPTVAAFVRAFRRWIGVSPHAFQRIRGGTR